MSGLGSACPACSFRRTTDAFLVVTHDPAGHVAPKQKPKAASLPVNSYPGVTRPWNWPIQQLPCVQQARHRRCTAGPSHEPVPLSGHAQKMIQ